MMKPLTTIYDIKTGETVTREMTDDEIAWFDANTSNQTFEETPTE